MAIRAETMFEVRHHDRGIIWAQDYRQRESTCRILPGHKITARCLAGGAGVSMTVKRVSRTATDLVAEVTSVESEDEAAKCLKKGTEVLLTSRYVVSCEP